MALAALRSACQLRGKWGRRSVERHALAARLAAVELSGLAGCCCTDAAVASVERRLPGARSFWVLANASRGKEKVALLRC
eukprot:4434284-Pleurochrysis_carterae.AAC.1